MIDGTSGAGGLPVDPTQFDVYYFAPQKCFAGDGGLWLALCSPAAIERIERIHASGRWVPPSLDLHIALENSRLDQTYNTPALATLFLLADQVEWMLGQRRARVDDASAATGRPRLLYGWAEASPVATPFVAKPAERSHVTATIDFDDAVDAAAIAADAAGQRHRRHRAVPQARPQPAAHRALPGDRARRRRDAHPGDRLRRRRAALTGPLRPHAAPTAHPVIATRPEARGSEVSARAHSTCRDAHGRARAGLDDGALTVRADDSQEGTADGDRRRDHEPAARRAGTRPRGALARSSSRARGSSGAP